MSFKVAGVLVILVIGDGLCMHLAVPSRNLASSASERSASGRYFNQNMYSKDDSKVRHMTTTLLDNDNSNSEKSHAKSEPFYGYPAGVIEPVALLETISPSGVLVEPSVLVEPCTKSNDNELSKHIPPIAIPVYPPYEPVNMYPQLQFPFYLPMPQPSLPAQFLEVLPKEPVQIVEEVQFTAPDSDTKESMFILETPTELSTSYFPPSYPSSAFYPSMYYPPGMYPFPVPQFPQQDSY